jgi:drug/metabolite transporter (DMT)-like permease
MLTLARIIRFIGAAIAFVIVVGIVLVVLDARESNGLVSAWLDVARWFTDPFQGLFNLDDNKAQLAVNWGIAAVVYFAIAAIIAKLLAMAGVRAHRPRRRRAVAH